MSRYSLNKTNLISIFTSKSLSASSLNINSFLTYNNQIRTFAVSRPGGPPRRPSILRRPILPNFMKRDKDNNKPSVPGIIKNQRIRHSELRVIYTDSETGETINKVMSRNQALDLAYDMEMELVFVDETQKPPVCKIIHINALVNREKEKKKRKLEIKQKNQTKEVNVGASIADGDLSRKIEQCVKFVSSGYQVNLVVRARRQDLKKNVSALEDISLKILDQLEKSMIDFASIPNKNRLEKRFSLAATKNLLKNT